MKNKITIIISILILLSLMLTSCSGGQLDLLNAEIDTLEIEKEDLETKANALEEEKDALNAKVSALEVEKEGLESRVSALEVEKEVLVTENNTLANDYEVFKNEMSVYSELSASEAQALKAATDLKAEEDRIALEELLAKQEEEKAQRLAAEQAAKEAEEKKGYETGITYNDIARYPDDYEGKKVKFRGRVIQVIEGNSIIQIRFAVNRDYDQIVFCEYNKDIVEGRILEDDTITIYGVAKGTITYESTMGGQITIPAVSIDKIDQ